jgi:hypothetical protein
MSILEITPDVIMDLAKRMTSHSQVGEMAIVVLTVRELEALLNVAESALAQGRSCKRCRYFIPERLGPCLGCGEPL